MTLDQFDRVISSSLRSRIHEMDTYNAWPIGGGPLEKREFIDIKNLETQQLRDFIEEGRCFWEGQSKESKSASCRGYVYLRDCLRNELNIREVNDAL